MQIHLILTRSGKSQSKWMSARLDKNNNLDNWPFNKNNYILFSVGLFIILLGYFLMWVGEVDSFQSVKLSPFLLIIGYLIIIPLSIFYRK